MEEKEIKEKIKKNDFIEIDYTLKTNGKIVDTTIKKEAEKAEIKLEKDFKPLKICVGQGMVVGGLDEDLIGKEIEKEYKLQLEPEKAFGKRNRNLIKTISLNYFRKNNLQPNPGMFFSIDNVLAKVISVSGGRVMIDFNNPLAGKSVEYSYRINRKISDVKEKIEILSKHYLGLKPEIINEDGTWTLKLEKINNKLIENFKKKVSEILNLNLKIEAKK